MSDITITRGDTIKRNLTFKDADGTAIDITGWTVSFTVRKKIPVKAIVTDVDAIIAKVITTHITPISGLSTFTLSKTDTNIDPGTYFYDIQVKNVAGEVSTITSGKFIVEYDITRL